MSDESGLKTELSAPLTGRLRSTVDDHRLEQPAPPDDDAPSGAELFTVLKNSRRRHVLQFLLEEERRVSLAELAVHIAAEENDVSPGSVTSAQRKRVYVSLYQSHLPLLDEVGAVEYNDARKYAHPVEHIEAFRPYIQPATTTTPPWSRWYLSVGVLGVVSSTLLATELVAVAALKSGFVLTLAVVFLLVAFLHSYSQRP